MLQVTDDLESFAQLRKGSAQPSEGSAQLSEGSAQPVKDAAEGSARRRRHSGKRNLHKPWTKVEEAELVCLVDQTDHRKQVRLSQPIISQMPLVNLQECLLSIHCLASAFVNSSACNSLWVLHHLSSRLPGLMLS